MRDWRRYLGVRGGAAIRQYVRRQEMLATRNIDPKAGRFWVFTMSSDSKDIGNARE